MPFKESSSVLLDTNVLISLADKEETPRSLAIRDEVRIAALTCDKFLVPPSTIEELNRFLEAKRTRFSIGSFDFNALKKLLDSKRVHILDKDFSFEFADTRRLKSIFRRLSELSPFPHRRLNLYMDAVLLLTSETLGVPILSADKKIRALSAATHAELEIPCPFDVAVLRSVPMDELFDMSMSLRRIYQEAFGNCRSQAKKIRFMQESIGGIEKAIQQKEIILTNQSSIIKSLNEEIEDLKQSETFWKEATNPNSTQTVCWTIVECALAGLGLPIPTSPISYFVDVIKHRRRSRK